MTGVPESARSLNQMALKDNMRIVVLDGDIPAPNGSGFIDPLDIRPKKISWDVSTNAIPATAKDGDHLQVTVGGVFGGVAYAVDDGAYVLDKVANKLLPIPKTPAVGGGSSTPVSGAVWVKSIANGPSAAPAAYLNVTQQSAYAIKRIEGNSTQLVLTIGAIPGVNSDTIISVYSVPGAFTPTQQNPYPAGTPAIATFGSVQGNSAELDNLEFTATVNITFTDLQAQLVILHSGGAYSVIRYDQVAPPLLVSWDVTSTYQTNLNAGGMIYDRSAFTSGETVNFSFVASAPISEMVIWPFDTVYNATLGPSGTPLVVSVTGAMVLGQFVGTGSFVIPPPITTNPFSAVALNKKLRAAARLNGQNGPSVESTTTRDYSNRPPQINLDYYARVAHDSFLVTIKGTEEAIILSPSPGFGTNITGMVADFSSGYLEQTLPAGVSHYDKRIHSGDWRIRRGPTGFHGLVTTTVTAYNFENGTTHSAVFRINVQDTVVPDPVLVVNNGQVITTASGGKNIPVSVDSAVCMQSNGGGALNVTSFTMAPTPHITRTTSSNTAIGSLPKTDVNGYQFDGEVKVLDSAPRGTYTTVTDIQLRTNAGTDVNFIASYRISGFDKRVLYFASAGSPNVNLVQSFLANTPPSNSQVPLADYPAGLVVEDTAGNVFINGVDYIYNAGSNRIEFQNTTAAQNYYQGNTGSLFVRVSQTPAP